MARKLGKKPPVNRPTVSMGDFFHLEKIPDHPTTSPAPDLPYPMDFNDVAGTCVVAGGDHSLQVIANHLGMRRENWSGNQIMELYRTQNPDFHSWDQGDTDADGGMVIQTFLEEMVRRGEIVAFGRVDHDNPEILRAATYIGLSLVTGSELQEAQQDQKVWDYVRGSGLWGGHCTNTVGYNKVTSTVVTWGELVPMTDSFVENRMDEAWMIITQSMINHPDFRNAFDLRGFSSAITDLTNGKVNVPVPDPVPNNPVRPITPTPPPPVPVDPALDEFPFAKMNVLVDHVHKHRKSQPQYVKDAVDAYDAWVSTHNLADRAANSRFQIVDHTGKVIGEVDNLGRAFFASQS